MKTMTEAWQMCPFKNCFVDSTQYITTIIGSKACLIFVVQDSMTEVFL